MAYDPEPDACIFFYGHNDNNTGYLSNFFYSPFTMTTADGLAITYQTAEQAIMAHKAELMGDCESLQKILAAGFSPALCKSLGRNVSPWNQPKWDSHVSTLAYNILYAKFKQHKSLYRKLDQTGHKVLVEAAPFDQIWGIGLSVKEAKAGRPWRGKNLLGITLMRVRSELRFEKKQQRDIFDACLQELRRILDYQTYQSTIKSLEDSSDVSAILEMLSGQDISPEVLCLCQAFLNARTVKDAQKMIRDNFTVYMS